MKKEFAPVELEIVLFTTDVITVSGDELEDDPVSIRIGL